MIYKDKILESIVSECFDTNIVKDDDILMVALSGGMDSMCLIDSLCRLQSERNFRLMAIHVHHGIRGIEADRDLAFVSNYCKSKNIKLLEEKVDAIKYSKLKGLTVEESARILRYETFEKRWKKLSIKYPKNEIYVVVAHHERDQAETVIHNMLRGTGIKGIAGMKIKTGNILRPLLYVEKEDIKNYINTYDVPYVEDTTNDDIKYTRNFIRNEILDKFEKVNTKAISHIASLAKQAELISNFIEKESDREYKRVIKEESEKRIIIELSNFRLKDDIIKAEIVKKVFDKLINTLKDITKINIEDIIELSEKTKGGHLDLPYNITVDKKQSKLIFTKNDKNVSMSRRKKK